jgi:hypothetical protein
MQFGDSRVSREALIVFRVAVCLTQIEFRVLAWYILSPLDSITVCSGLHSSAQIKEGERVLGFSQRSFRRFISSGLRRCGKYLAVDMASHTGWTEYPYIYWEVMEGGCRFSMFASIGTDKKVRTTESILNVKSLRHSQNLTEWALNIYNNLKNHMNIVVFNSIKDFWKHKILMLPELRQVSVPTTGS